MRIGTGEHTYEWIADWARIPDSESASAGWAHHGVVVTEAHGMSLAKDGQQEHLWIADPGAKRIREADYEYRPPKLTERRGQVDGWPNNKNEKGEVVPTQLLRPGKFNSPHGVAADNEGNLYVVEWLIGGRYTKLARR